ncbi:hypothetical protein JCM3766R1_004945 [Sporobolomyces carnicolor]
MLAERKGETAASDTWSLAYFLIEVASFDSRFADDSFELVAKLVATGLETWRSAERDSELQFELLEPLQNLIGHHVRLVLLTGRATTLPVRDCALLFADCPPPLSLVAPDNLDFMYDVLNEQPGTVDAAVKFMSEWIPSAYRLQRHLAIFLAYSPSRKLIEAIRHIWSRVDHLTDVLETLIQRIFRDPRYDKVPQELKQYRPGCRLSELTSSGAETIPILSACHRKLRGVVDYQALLQENKIRVFRQLDVTAGRMVIVASSGAAPGMRYLTLLAVVRALVSIPHQLLSEWSILCSAERES